MRMILSITLFAALVLAGCFNDTGGQSANPVRISAGGIDSVSVSGRTVTMQAVCIVPDPCWTFSHIEYTRQGSDYSVTIYARSASGTPCVQVLSSLKAVFTTQVNAPGSYSFRFWQSDSTSVDTTVVVQ